MATGDNEGREFNDYFHELNDIENDKESSSQLSVEELSKTPDEGEQEVAWLKDAGYGHLVSKIAVGEDVDAVLLAKETEALTETQAAVVRKRINTLKSTLRKQNKTRKPDVREIFSNVQQVENGKHSTATHSTQDVSASQPVAHKPSYRTSLLRHRGGYSMTGSSSAVVDGIVSPGISMLHVHPTDAVPFDAFTEQSSKPDVVDSISSQEQSRLHFNYVRQGSAAGQKDDPLPDLATTDDQSSGITRVDDIGKKDLDRVRSLALIELTALYDLQGITYVRRKAKGRGRENGLFGVSLQVLLEHDQKRNANLRVPLIFQELIRYLEATSLHEEGILRVPGAVARIKVLRQELETRYKRGQLSLSDINPHDAAALLKQCLRELPTPLLTFEYLEAFAQIDKITDLRLKVEALNFLVLLLPDVHRNTLQMLLEFLKKIVDVEQNKMTISNVAMIIAPNLFLAGSTRPSVGGARRTPKLIKDLIEVSMAAGNSNIVQLLINYQTLLWQVPPFIMSQVRRQYQAERKQQARENRPFRNFLGRKGKSDANKKILVSSASELQLIPSSKVIRVNAPQLSKFNTTIQLDQLLTAADVLARFSSTPELSTPNDASNGWDSSGDELESRGASIPPNANVQSIHLYEVGGNIGERRLDLGTNIMSLYQVNPNAELVIKKQPLC